MLNFEFGSPWWLAALAILPLLIWWQFRAKGSDRASIFFSNTKGFGQQKSWKVTWLFLLPLLEIIAVLCIILGLARPRNVLSTENIKTEGIDIVLAIDVSTSMLARDFKPDRLEASKEVAVEFIRKRKNDRIGLVVFAGESYTQCPLTTDHAILINFLQELSCGQIENGTAIGMGLANSVKRLDDSDTKSKVAILLTDGVNNTGHTQPLQAAGAAKKLNVKVYTIGVGTQGLASTPTNQLPDGTFIYGWAPVEIDEDLLKEIADETDGDYFRARDIDELKDIYDQIDKLETTEIESTTIKRYKDLFYYFLISAIICLTVRFILEHTLFKTII